MFRKIIGPGLLAGLIMLVVGMGLSWLYTALLPGLQAEYENTDLFRPWSDPLMLLYFIHPFVTGVVLAWIWDKVRVLFPGRSVVGDGLRFAVIYGVFSLGGMVISYSSFPLSLAMIVTWYVSILVEGVFGAVVLAKLNPRPAK